MDLFEVLCRPPGGDPLYKNMRQLIGSYRDINESLSIDETIKPYRVKIENEIIRRMQTETRWEDEYGIMNGYGDFEETLYGIPTKINYNVCIVEKDMVQSIEFSKSAPFNSGVKFIDGVAEVHIYFPIYETNEKDIYDIPPQWFSKNIAHELEHIRWFSILGKEPLNKIDKDKYKYAQDILDNNTVYSNPLKGYGSKKIANCLYSYYKFEQTAFIQGLDELFSRISKFSDKNYDIIYNKFKQTDEYRLLDNMREILDSPEDYKEEIKEIFNWPVDKFEKLVKKRYNEYLSMIGRGISYALYNKFHIYYDSIQVKINNIPT